MADPAIEALIEALPDPVMVIGRDNRVLAVNLSGHKLMKTDVAGWSYVTALRQPAILDAVAACLADGSTAQVRYGGQDMSWDVSVRPAPVANGPVAVLQFRDVSAVEDAENKRRDFVANVSHELRTPLTALVGFIETLRGPARHDNAAMDRFLDIMGKEAGRMHQLVEDLLSLSQVEDQQRVRPTDPVALGSLIGEVLEALEPVAAATQVTLHTDLPDGETTVPGDRDQLCQVLRNLVENAIKYGGGSVTVRLARHASSHTVELSVLDDGEGIAPHLIARLTERFFRVDSHRSRQVGGTGLGLAICKHIVSRHRGRLRIHSEVGQGTEFKVVLPTSLAG